MARLPFKHPAGCNYIDFDSIDRGNRGRDNYPGIPELAESIKTLGLLNPPVLQLLDPPVGTYTHRLIGGERRMLAMQSLGAAKIPCIIRKDVDFEGHRIELEIAENMEREDFTWQEVCKLIYKSHNIYKAESRARSETWGAKETGKLFKKSAAHVAHALLVAEALINDDKEIYACESITSAYNVLLRRKEQEGDEILARHQLQNTAGATSRPINISTPAPKQSGISIVTNDDDMDAVFGSGSSVSTTPDGAVSLATPTGNSLFFNGLTDFPLSSWCSRGDSMEVMATIDAESIDHIITDPPYGIDIDNDHLVNMSEVANTHVKSENLTMFPGMWAQFARILKPRSYCIVWIDLEHWELHRQLAKQNGFKLQNHPFTWLKTHQCKNNSPGTNFTNNTEFAIVARKGTATLETKGSLSGIAADGSIDRKMYSNPFSKPYEVWSHLITAVSRVGDTIGDFYAGQMSCPRAAINLGRVPRAVEIDQNHYNKGINILSDLIKEMAGKDVKIS
jgi:DNA modification methylase